jgi:O-antigen ligase
MAAVFIMLVRVRHRTYVTVLAFFAAIIVAVPIYYASDSYVSVKSFNGSNEARESAAYRREMIEQYMGIAEERPIWGWGSNVRGKGLYPRVEGMDSIDNHYLLLALNSGMYSLASMVLLLLWVPARLLGFGLRNTRDDPAASLAVTLMGSLILLAISISTAWLGAQTQPLLFIVAGWSEALLLTPVLTTAKVASPMRTVSYGFERVMV